MSYKLFQGDTYYPMGGYSDFKGSHNTFEEALKALDSNADWYEIVHNDKIVQSGDILHRDDAERLKRINTELVIGKPCIAGRGNTELIAWFKDERHNQVAILKSLPTLTK